MLESAAQHAFPAIPSLGAILAQTLSAQRPLPIDVIRGFEIAN